MIDRFTKRHKTVLLKDKRLVTIGRIIFVLCLLSFIPCTISAQTSEMETRYNALSERYDGRDKGLQNDLKAYMQEFPYTTYGDEVNFMQAVLQIEKGHYRQGLKILEQLDIKSLSRAHKTDYSFYRGYAYLMIQEYERAAVYFGLLRSSENPYTVRGTYYYAYCMYKLGQYDKALPALEQLENHPQYAKTVPFYIVQIHFANGRYEEVEQRANVLLVEQPESENTAELHRMLGEIYYRKKDYVTAVEHLGQYEQLLSGKREEPVRSDIYMLGAAHYQLGRYSECVNSLKRMKQQPDTLSEAACLTMGNAYVQLKQTEQAKLSYQAAASYALTPAITEEALYNYALCTYQTSSALGESVRAFNDFLHRFPDSKYVNKVYQLLSDALMQSKNYVEAIATLDSISDPTPRMLDTKQYLRYQLAADHFLQGKMPQTVEWATAVIEHTYEADSYTTEAYYLRAEAYYRLQHYAAGEQALLRFFDRSDAKQSANYVIARYLQGYCRFAQAKYDEAREAFMTYIESAEPTEPTYADALNRIGDCYFNAREFEQAGTYYAKVSDLQAEGSDYALFQRGYALGLQHKYADKAAVLMELVTRYPKSDYADDGLYEAARAQLQQDDERGAIATYDSLLAMYPLSVLARKASLERAMLYRNLKQTDEAVAAYKATIEQYPASEEAYTALEALQTLYVEADQVNEYLEYTKELAALDMHVTTQEDSLQFVAAEIQYMQAAYQKAASSLSNYIKQYCAGGRYCTTARYYLADTYYRSGKRAESLEQYKILADLAANPYQEEAAMRVAELCYDDADYNCALDAFYKMHSLASSRENVTVARLGILRCSQALGRHQEAIQVAGRILNDKPLSEETKSEAMYGRAKAYVAMGEWEKAQPDLQNLSAEVRTAQGAESKYLLAQSYFELQHLDEAESQVMAFTQMNTQQQYWLAKALILLSDINRERAEYFQARQYLLVLQQNYTRKGDDIAALIDERLATLDQLEQPEIKEEVNDEE